MTQLFPRSVTVNVSSANEPLGLFYVDIVLMRRELQNDIDLQIDIHGKYNYEFTKAMLTRFVTSAFLLGADLSKVVLNERSVFLPFSELDLAESVFNDVLTWIHQPKYYTQK